MKARTIITPLLMAMMSVAQAQTIGEMSDKVRVYRKALRNMTASVAETVKVSPEPPEDDAGQMGWGLRSGERRFVTAISQGRTYFASNSQFGGKDATDTREVRLSDRMLTSSKYYRQGNIGRLRGGSYNPLLGSYSFMGRNIDEVLHEMNDPSIRTTDTGNIQVSGRINGEHLELELVPSERMRLSRATATERGQPAYEVTIIESKKVGEDYIPGVTESLTQPAGNMGSATIRSAFVVDQIVTGASERLFQADWSEGMRVGDDIAGNVYLFKNGKLVLDPLFSQSARASKQTQGLLVVGGVALSLMTATILVRRRRHGRKSAVKV